MPFSKRNSKHMSCVTQAWSHGGSLVWSSLLFRLELFRRFYLLKCKKKTSPMPGLLVLMEVVGSAKIWLVTPCSEDQRQLQSFSPIHCTGKTPNKLNHFFVTKRMDTFFNKKRRNMVYRILNQNLTCYTVFSNSTPTSIILSHSLHWQNSTTKLTFFSS